MLRTLAVVALVAAVGSLAASNTYRSVSVWESDLLSLFVATAANVDVNDKGHGSGSIIVDATRLVMWGNRMQLLHFEGSAYAENNNLTSASGAGFDFYMHYGLLVEYAEKNGKSGYQPGEDEVASNYVIGTIFAPFRISTSAENQTATDGSIVTVYNITFTTTDDVFSYWVAFSGHNMNVAGTTLGANSVKMGFTIQYYKYLLSTKRTDTKIALVSVVATQAAAARAFNNNGQSGTGVSIKYGAYRGFTNFEATSDTWTKEGVYAQGAVHVDYRDNSNDGAIDAGYKGAIVILSYDALRPERIYYDPTMGAELPANSVGQVTVCVTLLFAALFALFM